MPELSPTVDLDARFSSEGASPRPWSEVESVLDEAEAFWLTTVRRDGRPHVTPLPAVWHDGSLHFCTGPGEQKAKNIEANPNCVLTTGSYKVDDLLDIVVEGRAARVTDELTLNVLAGLWKSKLDWPFEVVEGGFRHPADAMPEDEGSISVMAHVFAVAPIKVLAFAKSEPYSQTRYRF